METGMAERYRLQYMLLIKEFITEVEQGTEWFDLKPLLQKMKAVNEYIEFADNIASPNSLSPG